MKIVPPLLRSLTLWFAIIVTLGLAGCAGSRGALSPPGELPAAFPDHSVTQIRSLLDAQGDSLTAFRARASLSIRSPLQNGTLTSDLRHRRGDSLYMTFSPALGIQAARVLITPDSFFVYDRIKKQLFFGAVSDASTLLPAPIAGDDIFRTLLGLTLPDAETSWRLEADSAYYYLYDDARHRNYIVDPSRWRILRYEERAEDGSLVERRSYSVFTTFDDTIIPRRVILERPIDDTFVSLYYRSMTINPGHLSFDLDVGDSVERVRLDGSQMITYE